MLLGYILSQSSLFRLVQSILVYFCLLIYLSMLQGYILVCYCLYWSQFIMIYLSMLQGYILVYSCLLLSIDLSQYAAGIYSCLLFLLIYLSMLQGYNLVYFCLLLSISMLQGYILVYSCLLLSIDLSQYAVVYSCQLLSIDLSQYAVVYSCLLLSIDLSQFAVGIYSCPFLPMIVYWSISVCCMDIILSSLLVSCLFQSFFLYSTVVHLVQIIFFF